MRLVLDTNVWLDWLVFDDPCVAPLKQAQADGSIQIVINDACLDELDAVLAYPQFALDEAQRKIHLATVGSRTTKFHGPPGVPALPRCSDPDDQKFLELARDARSDWLITKDKALLGLRRGKMRAVGFRITTPLRWSKFQSDQTVTTATLPALSEPNLDKY
jgi:uncharacterized protein